VAAGDLLVGWFAQYNVTGHVVVSDPVNGTWTRGSTAQTFGGTGDIALYYVISSQPANGLTVTVSSPAGAAYLQGAAADYTPPTGQTYVADHAGSATGSGTTATSSTTVTAPSDLVYSALISLGSTGTITPSPGFTPRATDNVDFEQDAIATTTGTQTTTETLTNSTTWYATTATFTPTTAATPSPTPSP
jgi:hypothetical protein